MTKKSLFFGGLALLVLLVFAGCSNPSGDTEYVDRILGTGFDYPAGTVFTDDFYELDGLLNPADQPTNGVRNIAFYGEGLNFAAELRIPKGKTVYIEDTGETAINLGKNIIVEQDGVLVLVSNLATGDGKLLVKGSVEVYGGLTATAGALDVADYYEDGGANDAIYTVIGKKVSVKAGAWLVLKSTDIRLTDDSSTNKFTPQEAWAAAGQGHLGISEQLGSAFSVAYLLSGVSPSATRWYQVSTAGGGKLPAVIPVGADITAAGEIADAEGDTLTVNGKLSATTASFKNIKTLTVNGSLSAAAGTFENVETLTVSTVKTQEYSRAVEDLPYSVQGGIFTADGATLKKAKTITINDNGFFQSGSEEIDLPADAEIFLGAGAIFDANNENGNTFGEVVRLFIGPAARVNLASKSVSLAKLKYLTLRDGGSLTSAGEFAFELAEPAVQGKQSLITGKYAAGAKVDLQVNGDILINDEVAYTVTETSTLAIAEGATLTVPSGGVLDLSALKLPITAPATAPVTVNGTIKVEEGGTIIGPSLKPITVSTDKAAQVYTVFDFGSGGKLVLDWGATYAMGEEDVDDVPIVGASDSESAYIWVADTTDGARIEISGSGLTIRDTDSKGAVVTVAGNNAFIGKGQSLYLDTGVTLAVSDDALTLAGDAATGAKLLGPGSLIINEITTIKGGANGWQAAGGGNITFVTDNTTSKIGASAASTLTALGAGATIVQAASETKTLTITTDVTVNLAGSTTSPGGSITLSADENGGSLILVGKILAGAGTGVAITADVDTFTIDNAAMTLGDGITKANFFVDASNFLNQLQGAAQNNTITAGATDNVIIRSTAKVGATKK
jgi:hypothetical protein